MDQKKSDYLDEVIRFGMVRGATREGVERFLNNLYTEEFPGVRADILEGAITHREFVDIRHLSKLWKLILREDDLHVHHKGLFLLSLFPIEDIKRELVDVGIITDQEYAIILKPEMALRYISVSELEKPLCMIGLLRHIKRGKKLDVEFYRGVLGAEYLKYLKLRIMAKERSFTIEKAIQL